MTETIKEIRQELKDIKKELVTINSCKEALMDLYKKLDSTETSIKTKVDELDEVLIKLETVDLDKNTNIKLSDLKTNSTKKALDSYLEYLNTNPEFKQENSEIVFQHYIQELMNNDDFVNKMNENKK